MTGLVVTRQRLANAVNGCLKACGQCLVTATCSLPVPIDAACLVSLIFCHIVYSALLFDPEVICGKARLADGFYLLYPLACSLLVHLGEGAFVLASYVPLQSSRAVLINRHAIASVLLWLC